MSSNFKTKLNQEKSPKIFVEDSQRRQGIGLTTHGHARPAKLDQEFGFQNKNQYLHPIPTWCQPIRYKGYSEAKEDLGVHQPKISCEFMLLALYGTI